MVASALGSEDINLTNSLRPSVVGLPSVALFEGGSSNAVLRMGPERLFKFFQNRWPFLARRYEQWWC